MNAPATELQAVPSFRMDPNDGDGLSSVRWQLDVAQEMLVTMDTATYGGHRYLMEKIVALMGRVLTEKSIGSRRNRSVLKQQVQHLAQMAGREFLDTGSFVRRAQGVVDLLRASL